MKKKKLMSMSSLLATPRMMRMAENDILQKKEIQNYGYTQIVEWRKYDLFMRCIVENGILKLSLFSPAVMRLGGRKPMYDVFLDREKAAFLTYDHNSAHWLTGKLDTINWNKEHCRGSEHWISPSDNRILQQYLGTTESGMLAVITFQRNIREEELKRRHKRETDPWDSDMAQTPELPKDWDHWVDKVAEQEQFIFYDYVRGGATHGYCTYCEKEVPIRKPTYNKVGRCPCCRRKVTFKSTGQAGWVRTDTQYVYLLQACTDGLICREFRISHTHPKGKYTEPPERFCHEIRRSLFDSSGKQLRAYYWGVYKQQYTRWIKCNNCSPSFYTWYGREEGRVYGKTLPNLARRGLNRTGLIEYIKQQVIVDPEHYLAVYRYVPQLEQISKASLPALVRECLHGYGEFTKKLSMEDATSLTKMLGVNSHELKRLRENHGGTPYLSWLRYEKAIGREIPDRIISWFCKEKIAWEDICFIANRMSVVQTYNYVRRNMAAYKMTSKEVITTWADYLSMATRFKYDTSDPIVYRSSKLRQRHDELAARGGDKDITIEAGEILQKYPHLDDIIASLGQKYAYCGEEYVIIAPSSIEEIIMEGRKLHHCLSHAERYWERMEKHESYLLFLRRAATPDEPYYTMEIEPGGTVRQIRTYYDRQNKDIDEARNFLRKWQFDVAKRLTADDQEKAKASKVLRLQEFAQLRQDQVKIHTGSLAGHLLVDVLTADLMESAAA